MDKTGTKIGVFIRDTSGTLLASGKGNLRPVTFAHSAQAVRFMVLSCVSVCMIKQSVC